MWLVMSIYQLLDQYSSTRAVEIPISWLKFLSVMCASEQTMAENNYIIRPDLEIYKGVQSSFGCVAFRVVACQTDQLITRST